MTDPYALTVVYDPTPDQLAACQAWHGGQASTFYAVASTGSLATGTRRPSTVDHYDHGAPVWRPMTDAEWRAELLDGLWREAHATTGEALDAGEAADAETFAGLTAALDPLLDAANADVEREADAREAADR